MKNKPLPADFPHPNATQWGYTLFRKAFYRLSTRHKVAYCLALNLSVSSASQYADGNPDFVRVYERVLECINPRFSSIWQDRFAANHGVAALYARIDRARARLGFDPLSPAFRAV